MNSAKKIFIAVLLLASLILTFPGLKAQEPVTGDLDGDGSLTIFDYNILVGDFGKKGSPGFSPADVNRDGQVTIADYTVILSAFSTVIVKETTLTGAPTQTPTAPPAAGSMPRGIYALIPWSQIPNEQTWKQPFVEGVVIRTYWRDLEPREGTYNWDYIDRVFEQAKSSQKKVRLMVVPGFYSPDWVIDKPEIKKTRLFTVPQGPEEGNVRPLPLPWDATYLQLWYGFLEKLARRYKDRPEFTYISVTGPNSHNGEVNLPDGKEWLTLVSGSSDDEKIASLRSLLQDAYEKTMAQYCTIFRPKYFTMAFLDRTFPVPVPTIEGFQDQYVKDLIARGRAACPSSFGMQTNGLDGRPIHPSNQQPLDHWQYIQELSGQNVFTAFQTRAPGNLYDCKTQDASCTDRRQKILRQALMGNAAARHASVIEVYESDILDPTLTTTISDAHSTVLQY